MFVDGLVVMIVGAGPGLGATLARRCADDGADLVLAARTTGTLEQIAADVRACGRRVWRGRPTSPTATRCGRSPTPPSKSSVAPTSS
jgi:NAD(P)-dependent dehydrogenase (short-subunit alcohol dehydrogenase family)